MTFELDADGVRVRCSSPEWTRKLVEKGARLVDPAQAAFLGDAEEPSARAVGGRSKKGQRKSPASSAPAER